MTCFPIKMPRHLDITFSKFIACHDSTCSRVNENQFYKLLSPLLLQITDYMKLQYKKNGKY